MAQWLDTGPTSAACAALVGGIGVALLCWRRSNLLGTTLIPPWYWTLGSITTIAGSEIGIGLTSGSANWHSSLRFVAASSLFCPMISVLGAKRPQDKPWQMIVLSLWVVLILPAGEQMFLQPNQPLEIHGIRSWFLLLLIGLSFLNNAPTRFWPSAILLTASQAMLLASHLPLSRDLGTAGTIIGFSLAVGAIALPSLGLPRQGHAHCAEDRLWLDFRDSFGMLWGMRVWERINLAIEMYQWEVLMTWRGVRKIDGSQFDKELPSKVGVGMRKTLRNLLRRFVSQEWIADRVEESRSE